MVYNYVGGKICIAKVLANYKIDYTDWQTKAPVWIQDAMAEIGVNSHIIDAPPYETEIEDHRFKFPCDLKVLKAIEWNEIRMERVHIVNPTDSDDIEYDEVGYDLLQNGWAWCTEPDGTVTIHYKKLPVEFDSELGVYFPLVPDLELVHNAIADYLLYRCLTSGYKHPIFNLDSRNLYTNPALLWERSKKVARNEIGSMDADARNDLSKIMREFLTDPYAHFTQMFATRSDSADFGTYFLRGSIIP